MSDLYEGLCPVCHRLDEECCCNKIQPWAISNYPGEHNLVKCHPANSDEMWYRRADADGLIGQLQTRLERAVGALRKCNQYRNCANIGTRPESEKIVQYNRDVYEIESVLAAEQEAASTTAETCSDISPSVMALAADMQFKLDKNKHKGCDVLNPDGSGRTWANCSFAWLLGRAKEEIAELDEALNGSDYRSAQLECADVANFAMMIHDRLQALMTVLAAEAGTGEEKDG